MSNPAETKPGTRWVDLLYLAPGFALIAFLFRRVASGSTAIGADVGLLTIPQLQHLARNYRALQLPGWNPGMGLGLPLLADPTLGASYPGHFLGLLLPPLLLLNVLFMGHLALGYAGTYVVGRQLALSRSGACSAALVFALGGVSLGQLNTPPYVGALAWTPWAIVGILEAERGRWRRGIALSAPAFALIYLIGAPENCVIVALLALLIATARARGEGAALPKRAVVVALGGSGLFALTLAAVSLIPATLALPDAQRALGYPLAIAGKWSLHPAELVGLLVPQAFASGGLSPELAGQADRTWHQSLYLGALPLACLGLAITRARTDRRTQVLLLGAGVSLVAAFGVFGPVFTPLRTLLPGGAGLRYPAKMFVPALFLLAFVAGIGLDALGRQANRRRGLALTLVVAGCAGGAVVAAVGSGRPELAARGIGPLIAAGVGGLLLWRWPARVKLLLIVILLDLAVAGAGLLTFVPRAAYASAPHLASAVKEAEGRFGQPQRVYSLPEAKQIRLFPSEYGPLTELQSGFISQRETLQPSAGLPFGIRSGVAFTGIASWRSRALVGQVGDPVRAARVLGSRLVVTTDEAQAERQVRLNEVGRYGPIVLADVPGAPLWAATYTGVRPAPSAESARERVSDPAYDPRRLVVVEGAPGSAPAARARPARLVRERPDELVFEVGLEGPGYLVVREAWARGWVATVDGAPAPVLPADGVFRAVPVPAGQHRVELRYTTPGFRLGLGISLLALLALLAVLVAPRRAGLSAT